MWPQTLQISDDECRSTLRRLELDTYANVVGTFRAQGGLNERKSKLLDELRSIFHISQDRHRAEARRVANDELLSTIARAVSGPNTWQEWSREGRRSYPMLPRVAPQTALGWIANNLAAEAGIENSKLPYPVETSAAALEEQEAILAASNTGYCYPEKFVVKSDPFKTPEIPSSGVKKNLKRNIVDGCHSTGSSSSKRRNLNDNAIGNKQKHVTAFTNTTGSNRKLANLTKYQEQQRYFYIQQQKSKKLAKAAIKREKLPGPGRCGRKSKRMKDLQLKFQEEQSQHSEESHHNYQQQKLAYTDYQASHQNINETQEHIDDLNEQKNIQFVSNERVTHTSLTVPQVASSKRDISRNLTKLNMPASVASAPTNRTVAQLDTQPVPSPMSPSQPAHSVDSPVNVTNKTISDGKLTPLSTPVQKYIVEERQPPAGNIASVPAVATSPTQQSSISQYLTLPQFSTTNKLRSVNTTVIPSGTKLSPSTKKLSGTTILPTTVMPPGTQVTSLGDNISHFYNTMDGNTSLSAGQANQSTASQQLQQPPTAPTHAPPTVIQLHSNEVIRVGAQQSPTTATQSKVITTKILPIVLSGGANSGSTNISKTDAAKNGSTTPSSSIIKSLPSSVFVTGQHINTSASSSSSPVSTFGTGGQIFRKHPNILKNSSTALGRSSSINNTGPQILSNIRLTPAISTMSNTNNTFTVNQSQSNIFQHQIRGASSASTGIRTNVKICQSPNGKVFIQPANVDASKLSKISSGQITQRILPGTLIGSGNGASNSNTSNQPGSPHRIAIQKVQIIPAPLSNVAVGGSQTQHQQRQGLVVPKSNLGSSIFFSSTSSGAITLGKDNSISSLLSNIGTKQPSEIATKTSNVVVIDTTPSGSKGTSQQTNISRLTTSNNANSTCSENCQMITEDTPVDIIVDNNTSFPIGGTGAAISTNESTSITAVLTSNLIDRNVQSKQSEGLPTMMPIAVLSATDWEMELDQATAANALQNQQTAGNASKIKHLSDGSDATNGSLIKLRQTSQHHETLPEQLETADTIIIDDSFEDVIIEEEEEQEREEATPMHDDYIVLDNTIAIDERAEKNVTEGSEEEEDEVDASEIFDAEDDEHGNTQRDEEMHESELDNFEESCVEKKDFNYEPMHTSTLVKQSKINIESNIILYNNHETDLQPDSDVASLSNIESIKANQEKSEQRCSAIDNLFQETKSIPLSDSIVAGNVFEDSTAQITEDGNTQSTDSEDIELSETETFHMQSK